MQSSLNRDLSNIHKWLLCNKLTLNTTKTEFILIVSRQKLSTLFESLELSIDKVQDKVQNRAARILTSSSYDADAGYLLQRLGWKDLIAQRQIQVALMVFKALIMI